VFNFQIKNTKRVGELTLHLPISTSTFEINLCSTIRSIAEKQELGLANWFVFSLEDRLICFRFDSPLTLTQ